MPTKFDEIYDIFLGKIEDYEILDIINKIREDFQDDEQKIQNILSELFFIYLKSSINKFTDCTQDLSKRNDESFQFELSLTGMEIEILATLMVVEYLSPKVIRSENLESYLGSKDFRQYSPANQLKETRSLREAVQLEASSLILDYYYRSGY